MIVTHLIHSLVPTSNQLDDVIPDPHTWCGAPFVERMPWPERATNLFVFDKDIATCSKCLSARQNAIMAKGSTCD